MGKAGILGALSAGIAFSIGWIIMAVGTYMSWGNPWFWWSLTGTVLVAIGGGLGIITATGMMLKKKLY